MKGLGVRLVDPKIPDIVAGSILGVTLLYVTGVSIV